MHIIRFACQPLLTVYVSQLCKFICIMPWVTRLVYSKVLISAVVVEWIIIACGLVRCCLPWMRNQREEKPFSKRSSWWLLSSISNRDTCNVSATLSLIAKQMTLIPVFGQDLCRDPNKTLRAIDYPGSTCAHILFCWCQHIFDPRPLVTRHKQEGDNGGEWSALRQETPGATQKQRVQKLFNEVLKYFGLHLAMHR